jgi:hypothetical protein
MAGRQPDVEFLLPTMSTPSDAPPKLDLNIVQLLAGTLAAVTAAVVASRLGVAGTVIGTAVGSIVATVGGALYTVSIRRTHARLQRLRSHGGSPVQDGTGAADSPAEPAGGESVWRRLHLPGNWPVLAGSAVAVFVLAMGTVWAVENFVLGGKAFCAITGGCNPKQTSSFAPPPPETPTPEASASPFERATPSPTDTTAPGPVVSARPTSRPIPSATAPQASGSPAP